MAGPSLFERLRPRPAKKVQEPSPPQKLLDWIQRWNKPSVCARDIRIYGPSALNDPKCALAAAEVLVKHGWLIPLKTWRRDRRQWEIVRRPIVHPTVAAE
jgi:hypothetical protein